MIKGNKLKDYNSFEVEMNSLIGSFYDGYGLEHFFEHLYHTFLKSENSVRKFAQEYQQEFDQLDAEIQVGIEKYDPQHYLKSAPLVDTLRKSYFITAHSEFEATWKEVVKIHNAYFTPARTIGSLNDKFLLHSDFNPRVLPDKVVLNHKVILSYNYIRNKIVHQKANINSSEFITMNSYITSGKINNLVINVEGTTADFYINDIKFVKEYTDCVISFLKDIVDTSYSDRRPTT